MEIFFRNLDPDSNDKAFARQLHPIMKDLSISHYHCEKPRKKPFGFVTFLSREQGELFLAQHGELPLNADQHGQGFTPNLGRQFHRQNRPSTKSRLTMLGREIFCKESNRAIDSLTIHALQNSSDDKKAPKDNKGTAEPMSFTDLSECACGYYAFRDGKLTFISEWNMRTQGSAKFTKKLLIIRLSQENEIQIRIPIQSIVELNASYDGNMTLSLTTTPTFLKSPSAAEELASLFSRSRSTLTRVSAIDDQHQRAVAFCLIYRIQFQSRDISPYRRHIRQLKKQNVLSIVHNLIPTADAPGSGFLSYDDRIAKLNTRLALWDESGRLPFAILFQLQALAYNGYFPPDILERVAYRLVGQYTEASDTGEKPPSAEAIQKLFRWIDYRTTETRAEELEIDYIMSLLQTAQEEVLQSADTKAGQGQSVLTNATRVFRATVMPSRIILQGPELEAQNRVLRKFPSHQDYFLRVQFCDDDGRDLFFNSNISVEPIYKRFRSVLEHGIPIAGRIYKFLGFSHSSLRAHSAWFTAPFIYQGTVFYNRNIIEDLGNFSKIRCPARKAARIGQAFSETPFFVPLDVHDIKVTRISDVWNGDRIFSDGVGGISTDALTAAWKYLPESSKLPTCLQIRFAGAKGMLALDPKLGGKQIAIRQSMVKFESEDVQNLEICDTSSRPINLVLNRQMIKILEDMGVPYEWFLDLQNQEMQLICNATRSTSNAYEFLKAQHIGEGIHAWNLFRTIDSLGVEYRRDPFLRSVVEAAVLKELRLLKHRARIPVRLGITLFGVMDETGFLKEGEVYFTYDSMAGRF